VQRALQAQEQAHGPGRHLGGHGHALGVGPGQQLQLPAPAVAAGLHQGERQRPPRLLGHAPEDAELGVDVPEVGHDLEDALAGGPDGTGDAHELVGSGRERGSGLAPAGAVVERAGRGEPQRAGLHRLGG
jgi:hypothetical protein